MTANNQVAPAGTAAHGQAEQFTRSTLHVSDLDGSSPIPQFHAWFRAAQSAGGQVPHPETCTLATAALPSGRVSARAVYLKELDRAGHFVVYSNFATSRKAADLGTNPHAALVFWWEALQRQVRVEGLASRLSAEESQAYFSTRVRGSRVGAWASRQSSVLAPRDGVVDADGRPDDGRAQLDGWYAERAAQFDGVDDVPVPEFWGGLRIVPDRVEFWQGRENRLHDRFVYVRDEGSEEDKWTLERLSP